mgnify:CR=1 FL=1
MRTGNLIGTMQAAILVPVLALALAAASSAAHAQSIGIESHFGGSALSYSGQYVADIKGKQYSGRVWRAPEMERREMTVGRTALVSIVRMDRQEIWFLAPQQRLYVVYPVSAPEMSAYLPQPALHRLAQRQQEAAESVNGIATTRYKVSGVSELGAPYEGVAWFTADGALAGVDVDVPGTGQVRHRLTRLTPGAVDRALFDLPAGFTQVPPEQAIAIIGPLTAGRR